MGIIIFLAIGAIAGWLASLIFKGSGSGLIINIIIGILGGFFGGWLFGNFFGESMLGGIVTAVLGAIILLWLANLIIKK